MKEFFTQNFKSEDLLLPIIFSILLLIAAWFAGVLLIRLLRKAIHREHNRVIEKVVKLVKTPIKLLTVVLAISLINYYFKDSIDINGGKIIFIILVFTITYLAIAIIRSIKHFILSSYNILDADNLKARKIHTQMRVFERLLIFLVTFIGMSVALLSFEKVREIGLSLLASAGIAGIIIGFAAQKSLSLLLAGFQIAITQPIRLDDVVIVEGEWGWIEEITLTYVVVRIWDKRRLIVPINYFIEKPFQNWTRQSADILGTVFIYVDYGFPVEKMREEMSRILPDIQEWDGEVNVLQVTDATEKTMELRALVSAKDSPKAWDLRVRLREELIQFMQREYPDYLPKARIEFEKENNLDSKEKVLE
nr:mechanosensitive ion channel domain-containing protein [uncultured Carboxylicivirga sp.]